MSIISNINLASINATNLQGNLSTQVNEQIARSRTTWNIADQTAPNDQLGQARNNLNAAANASWKSNFDVKDISAVNAQNNEAAQISDQDALASASSRRGISTAANTLSQRATSNQDGTAFNRINVSDYSEYSNVNVDIKDISAHNQQNNDATQVNTQKAISSTRGWDLATNGAWQTATNWQGGSAYNTINVKV
jgi:hypothetical protein